MQGKDYYYLELAYQEAIQGLAEGGIPIGAVLVINDQIVARGHNKRIQENSMIKHGETDCLENTQRLVSPKDLQQSTLYTTLSPCYMCAGTILLYNIPRVVIGEHKTFQQSEALLLEKGVNVSVLNDEKCVQMMLSFIQEHMALWGEDIGLTPEQVFEQYKELFLEYNVCKVGDQTNYKNSPD